MLMNNIISMQFYILIDAIAIQGPTNRQRTGTIYIVLEKRTLDY